jgi:hypothetical protein
MNTKLISFEHLFPKDECIILISVLNMFDIYNIRSVNPFTDGHNESLQIYIDYDDVEIDDEDYEEALNQMNDFLVNFILMDTVFNKKYIRRILNKLDIICHLLKNNIKKYKRIHNEDKIIWLSLCRNKILRIMREFISHYS